MTGGPSMMVQHAIAEVMHSKRQRGHVQWRLLDVLERGSAKFDVARLGPHA